MKTPLITVLVAVVLVVCSTLAVMNNACKSSQHGWCQAGGVNCGQLCPVFMWSQLR
jgi:hypothetical protein